MPVPARPLELIMLMIWGVCLGWGEARGDLLPGTTSGSLRYAELRATGRVKPWLAGRALIWPGFGACSILHLVPVPVESGEGQRIYFVLSRVCTVHLSLQSLFSAPASPEK